MAARERLDSVFWVLQANAGDVATHGWLDSVFCVTHERAGDVATRGWMDSAFRVLLAVLN